MPFFSHTTPPPHVNTDILDITARAIDAAGLTKEARLGVALSGGADSTALLLALHSLGYDIEALHCNFELRGRESDADEAVCRRLCRQHSIPLSVKHFRTRAIAERQGISIEMAARQLRYAWFGEMARQHGLAALCVAHHRDDNIETMLINLVRGTGLHGLTGMKAVTRRDDGLTVVRPLLQASRKDIEAWLRDQDVTWRTDSSNLDADAALRNAIRLRLLPMLETMNPAIRQTLDETALRLNDAATLYDDAIAQAKAEVTYTDKGTAAGTYTCIDITALLRQKAPQTVLYELLTPFGFNRHQVADIMEHLDGEAGHVWNGRDGIRLLRDRKRLVINTLPDGDDSNGNISTLPLEGRFMRDGITMHVCRQVVDADFVLPRNVNNACFDLQRLTLPLMVRRQRPGDRIRPFGMEGSRLVSDVLTDAKVSLFERERQLVVLSGDDIIWVVGRRVASGYEITPDTHHALILSIEGA